MRQSTAARHRPAVHSVVVVFRALALIWFGTGASAHPLAKGVYVSEYGLLLVVPDLVQSGLRLVKLAR